MDFQTQDNLVEAIEEGRIVRVSESYAKREGLPILRKSFVRLEDCARGVQQGKTYLIEPEHYGGICYDPPDAIYLELLYERTKFYDEFLFIVESFLKSHNINYDKPMLQDLFVFQKTVMAHPNGPIAETLNLKYDWINYFLFTFGLREGELKPVQKKFKIVDPNPCDGDTEKFFKYHFDIRGEPVFNQIFDEEGNLVFPPVPLK